MLLLQGLEDVALDLVVDGELLLESLEPGLVVEGSLSLVEGDGLGLAEGELDSDSVGDVGFVNDGEFSLLGGEVEGFYDSFEEVLGLLSELHGVLEELGLLLDPLLELILEQLLEVIHVAQEVGQFDVLACRLLPRTLALFLLQ